MSESEFSIIEKYFATVTHGEADDVRIGIGDDAAVIIPHSGQDLLIAIDTLNSGIHFPERTSAFDIAYKALAVNLSDIAAMGGTPAWFTLSVSLPEIDHEWLKDFCLGLSQLANAFNLKLIGGDTTKGPLSVTVQIAGYAERKKALTRAGARLGDNIYVTGTLGDAAAGLRLSQQGNNESNPEHQYLLGRLNRPTPRINIGLAIRPYASSCIDISDGLVADLGHILQQSKVGAVIDPDSIPCSAELLSLVKDKQQQLGWALSHGDDYELCFTAAPEYHQAIEQLSEQTGCVITKIGSIREHAGLFVNEGDKLVKAEYSGFDHFATQ